MDRLKTLGTWVLLVIAFYIFSQVITYLFLGGPKNVDDNISNNVVTNNSVTNNDITNSITNELNETNTQNTATNNTVTNRIKILN